MFGLSGPVTRVAVKARYKELVKRHHPDTNNGAKAAEEKNGLILVTGATGYVGGRLVPRLLAVGHDDLGDARALQGFLHLLEVKGSDDRVGDDCRGSSRQVLAIEIGAPDELGADMDGIRAAAEGYAEAFHRSPSFSISSRASASTVWRPVSTTRSAMLR